eukprot:15292340-Heterocapsa_arctica.AAC.1
MARPRHSSSPRRKGTTEETACTSYSDSSASEIDESGNQGDDSQYDWDAELDDDSAGHPTRSNWDSRRGMDSSRH